MNELTLIIFVACGFAGIFMLLSYIFLLQTRAIERRLTKVLIKAISKIEWGEEEDDDNGGYITKKD